VIAVLCGFSIAVTFWLLSYLGETFPALQDFFHPHWIPSLFVGLPSGILYLLVTRLFFNPSVLTDWLGKLISFFYFPLVGALIGRSKNWWLWCIVLLAFHAILFGLFLYFMANLKITF
jgi:hypothetical protein